MPRCLPLTESMVNADVRFPNFTVDMPKSSVIERLLNNHLNSIGKSPDVTKHWTLVESPEFEGSPPKSK